TQPVHLGDRRIVIPEQHRGATRAASATTSRWTNSLHGQSQRTALGAGAALATRACAMLRRSSPGLGIMPVSLPGAKLGFPFPAAKPCQGCPRNASAVLVS